MPRLAPLLVFAAACSPPSNPARDAGSDPDAPDAAPDGAPDTTPPQLLAIAPAPASDVWLHEPLRFEFDEPIRITDAKATAAIGALALAATVAQAGDRALIVTLAPTERGVGTLELELAGVVDLAGNAAAPVDASYPLAPWQQATLDAGVAMTQPALAIAPDGDVVVAWIAFAGGARHLVVERHEAGAWRALGAPLGGDATSAAIALAADGAPIAGWIDGGTAHTARWDGSAWLELPSLGAASQIALAGTDPATALVIGSAATVATLAGATWQPLGGTLALGGGVIGAPALAADGDRVVAGWVTQGAVRVARYTGSWTAMPAISATAAHVAVAVKDQLTAVAWDDRGPSWGVYAATATGSAWTRLGHALDVDVAGDARAPAIALDAAGQPVVAWHERIETAERGIVARWSAGAWAIVGGRTWLASATAVPSPPALALHAGGAPVIATAVGGTLAVARMNGPKTPALGMIARASIAGCRFDAANPPARALQTGCFTLAAPFEPVPHAGLVPYDVVAELWSDGAKKRRWIALPDGASMTMSPTGAWSPPVGTVLVKEFALETTPGDPTTRRTVETRFLARTPAGWQGFSYQWRPDGTDADLLNDGQFTYDWPMDDGSTHTHVYPSRSHCVSCHDSSYGPLLGLRPQNLDRWFDYDGVIADQIPTLAALAVGPATTATPFAAPHDTSYPIEQRVRGYMAANCAHCHNPLHIDIKDLRYTTPLAQTRLCEVIVPGSPSQSKLYQLVSSRPGMPPLATLATDPMFVGYVGTWIANMTSCP